MLWYCRYKKFPNASLNQIHYRLLEQADRGIGTTRPPILRGWYTISGSADTEGFLLLEATEGEIDEFLSPHIDDLKWEVRPVVEWELRSKLEAIRRNLPQPT